MRAVPTNKTLSNPTLVHRQTYIWRPFLDHAPRFFSRDNQLQDLYDSTIDQIDKNPPPALELENVYHEQLIPRLRTLRNRIVVFTTGISADQTNLDVEDINGSPRPHFIGIDPMNDRNKLSFSIAKINKELYEAQRGKGKEFPLDLFVYVPIAPVFFPYRINHNFQVAHLYKNATKAADEVAMQKGKRTFGDLVKDLEPEFKRANWKFSSALYDTRVAKIFFPDEEDVQLFTVYNNYLQGNVLAKFISEYIDPDTRHPKGILHIYAKKGSYAFHIIDIAQKVLEEKFGIGVELSDFGGIMRNTDFSSEGECDPRALDCLKGFLYSVARSLI